MLKEEDTNFIRTLIAVLAALAVFSVVLLFVARAIGEMDPVPGGAAEAAERIAPVGEVKVAAAEQDTVAAPPAESQTQDAPSVQPSPGSEAVAEATEPAAAAGADKGKAVYDSACVICHAAGVAGAPKVGDKAAWVPRIAQGTDTVVKHAIEGLQGSSGMMPPKGGRTDLSDEDVKAAVLYMIDLSQ
jgi:cytochrome c5